MTEIWKEIPEYSGIYSVSNKGNVRNNKTKTIKKQEINPLGYCFVGLSFQGRTQKYRVHRLVALTFIPNPENKPNINHLDSNPSNNAVENLSWCTQQENIQYAYTYGNKVPTMNRLGSKAGSSSKYHNVHFEVSRNRWIASVEFRENGLLKKYRKNFSVKKHGNDKAEKLAALAVNEILDMLNDQTRPRNPIKLLESGEIINADT